MKFELTGRNHSHEGKDYVKGDVIETEHDLATRFPGRFKLVSDVQPAPVAEPVAEVEDAPQPILADLLPKPPKRSTPRRRKKKVE